MASINGQRGQTGELRSPWKRIPQRTGTTDCIAECANRDQYRLTGLSNRDSWQLGADVLISTMRRLEDCAGGSCWRQYRVYSLGLFQYFTLK